MYLVYMHVCVYRLLFYEYTYACVNICTVQKNVCMSKLNLFLYSIYINVFLNRSGKGLFYAPKH